VKTVFKKKKLYIVHSVSPTEIRRSLNNFLLDVARERSAVN